MVKLDIRRPATKRIELVAKTRDTVTYELKRGRTVVYRGTTNDLESREQQHRSDGKRFDKIVPTSRKMTSDGAKKKEAENLQAYRRSHSGKNPVYNKDSDG